MEKNKNKPFWAAAAGLLDPELRKAAQNLADAIPQGSPLRTKGVERILGALKGVAEAKAEDFSTVAGVVTEKATDFHDFFAAVLGSKTAPSSEEMIKEIMRGAPERIKKAADPAAEVERIRAEIKAAKDVAELAKQELPPPPDPAATITALTEKINAFNAKLEGKVEKMKKWADAGKRR